MARKSMGNVRKTRCWFCTKEGCPRPAFVDYKDVVSLKKLCTGQGKLFSRKRSGTCAAFQRALGQAGLERRTDAGAVLGSGLDRAYPTEHAGLAGEIAARGAVLCEFPLGTT